MHNYLVFTFPRGWSVSAGSFPFSRVIRGYPLGWGRRRTTPLTTLYYKKKSRGVSSATNLFLSKYSSVFLTFFFILPDLLSDFLPPVLPDLPGHLGPSDLSVLPLPDLPQGNGHFPPFALLFLPRFFFFFFIIFFLQPAGHFMVGLWVGGATG